jgi:hypothetical protein
LKKIDFYFFYDISLENKIMEINEVVSYYLNSDTNILDVTFRTIDDSEDQIRTDSIDFKVVEEYGYELETESFDFFSDDEEFDEDTKEIEFDEQELLSFLNEYYTVNPDSLPLSEIY